MLLSERMHKIFHDIFYFAIISIGNVPKDSFNTFVQQQYLNVSVQHLGALIRVVHQNAFVWNQLAALLYPFWGPRQTTSQKIGSLRPFLRCSLEIGIFRS